MGGASISNLINLRYKVGLQIQEHHGLQEHMEMWHMGILLRYEHNNNNAKALIQVSGIPLKIVILLPGGGSLYIQF